MCAKGLLRIEPATYERWPDLQGLFGPRGACGGCWCMFHRLSRPVYERNKGAGNKKALKSLLVSGNPPGLLAYQGDLPVGWCSIGPRNDFPRLDRSRVTKAVDDRPVWSITCLFVIKEYRNRGISVALIRAAVKHARSQGAVVVEAYPVEPQARYVDTFAFMGLAAAYRKAGFVEVARRTPTRPIMRTP